MELKATLSQHFPHQTFTASEQQALFLTFSSSADNSCTLCVCVSYQLCLLLVSRLTTAGLFIYYCDVAMACCVSTFEHEGEVEGENGRLDGQDSSEDVCRNT